MLLEQKLINDEMDNQLLTGHPMAPSELAHLNNSPTPNLQTIGESLPLPPPPVNRLVQDVIEDQFLARPDAQAIASRTVNLTYKELDESSSRLATQISSSGVSPGCIVPILHEKVRCSSIWSCAFVGEGERSPEMSHQRKILLAVN